MNAVIKTGGKQYLVTEGQKLVVEKLLGEVGSPVSFNEVLLVMDGDTVKVGKPILPNAVVAGTVVRQGRARKIIVMKFKPKVRYRKKRGHRQLFTEVSIQSISG